MTKNHAQPAILIIDDDRAAADLYERWLADDYTVHTTYSGAEALDCLDEVIDVVLLDRRMPGLHGDEVLASIRAHGFRCRVAMVTAIDPDFDIIEMGFDDYLVKPVSPEDMRDAVHRLIRLATYDDLSREYFALCRKKGVLEAEKLPSQLATSDEYSRLEQAIADARTGLDTTLARLDESCIRAVLRDLAPPAPGNTQ